MAGQKLINSDGIQSKIHTIRGFQVMIDTDLAELYQVEVKDLGKKWFAFSELEIGAVEMLGKLKGFV